ncbi:MAG: sugar phosphate nucleotidyltransferase [Bacillota bacterium]
MKGIIMAGGKGSRLRPLTCDRPKPLVPIVNKPVMEYAIELLRFYGVTEIGVTLQYLPEKIVDYFGDGKAWNVNLYYFVEENPLGTAGSVKNAEDFLDETFIVISGDALTDFNLASALDFHHQKQSKATIVLTTVENPLEYGVVITGSEGQIVKFLEKPDWGEVFSDQVNTGIYILEPEILTLIPQKQFFDFSKDLFPLLLKHKMPLYGKVLDGYWCDIGNLEQYYDAHRAFLAGEIKLVPSGIYQGDGIWVGQGTKLDSSVSLKGPLFLGDHCRVGSDVMLGPYTVLGNNVQVKERASIKKSILWDGCYIGKESELRGAVVCNMVGLEKGVSVFEGAVIGDHTIIERDSMIKPQVKIWPYKRLEKGAVLNKNFIWGAKGKKQLFNSLGIPGPFNREITPEVSVRLGAAYGSIFPINKKVAIAYDGQSGISMLKAAFMAGIQSTGVNIVDLGNIPFSGLRYGVEALALEGGVHLHLDDFEPGKTWFRFVSKDGYLFNKGEVRRLEDIYAREDVRRVDIEDLGLNYPLGNIEGIYADYLLDRVNRDLIKEQQFSLVVGTNLSSLTTFLPQLLKRLGVNVLGITGLPDTETIPSTSVPEALKNLANEVIARGGNLGAYLDSQGVRLFLVDEKGQILDENMYLLLVALIIFKKNPQAKVAVPVTAPQAMEVLAENFGGEIIRIKTGDAQLMEVVKELRFSKLQGDFNQQSLQFDGLLSLLKILEYLAESKQSLSALVEEIPKFYMEMQTIACPREAGGKFMRKIIEEKGKNKIELVDGIKIYEDDSWALILPDPDEPAYRIYSESFSQEAASELTAFYVNKVKDFLRNMD